MNIWLERGALISILCEAQASRDGRETGGILIGFETRNGVLITQAGGPGPHALRTRDFFDRDLDFAERLLQDAHARTGAVWVGDWHTHIDVCDRPSATDSQSYNTLLKDEELAFRQFISLVVTSGNRTFCDARISAWEAVVSGIRRADLVL